MVPYLNWDEELKKHRLGYDGGMVSKAMPVTWDQIKDALPHAHLAGAIPACDVAAGVML